MPTPRGGGVAIVAGVAAALLFFHIVDWSASEAWVLFAAAGLVAGIGLLDDRFALHPLVRLAVHVAAAFLAIRAFGPLVSLPLPAPFDVAVPPGVGWTLSVLWIVTVVNFFNFMDGIDGLAAGQATASCAGVIAAAWSPDAAALAFAVGGACVGFLFHNAPPARIFMGDSGSGFLGFTLAALPFLAPAGRNSDAVLAVAIGLALFLLDPVVTLIRRARERKNILQAHREHLYQQLVAPQEHAGRVAFAYSAVALLLALAGALGYRFPPATVAGCIAAGAAFLVVWHRAASRSTDARRRTRVSG